MANNRGRTSLKCKRKNDNPMGAYDRLPADLRHWVASAALPWRAQSVLKAYDKAIKRTGRVDLAMAELDRIQRNLLAKDAPSVWGQDYPALTERA